MAPALQRPSISRPSPKINKSAVHGLWALTSRDLRKWYKNPLLLIMSLVQPVIWLGLFGKALNFSAFITGAVPPAEVNQILLNTFGTTSYFSFLVCGMLAFVILFNSAFGGMSVVFDKRFGFMDKALSTPISRGTLVMAKVMQVVIRSMILAGIILVVGAALGMVTSHLTVPGILGAFGAMFLIAFGLSSLYVMLALRSNDWQTQMALINLINLPLLFASNALFPVKIMPHWLQTVVKFNPVSYANDAARQLIIGAVGTNSLSVDFAVLGAFAIVFGTVSIILSWKLLTK